MRGSYPYWVASVLPSLILIPTTTLLIFVYFDVQSIFRPFLALLFLLLCPGLPYIHLLRLNSVLEEFLLALVASIALDMLVAGSLLYADAWSAEATFYLLAAISYVGVAVQLTVQVFRD